MNGQHVAPAPVVPYFAETDLYYFRPLPRCPFLASSVFSSGAS
jgi:hypothetical protein